MTENEGLVRFHPDRRALTRYRHQPRRGGSLPSDTVYALLQDRRGRYWVATARGLARFDGAKTFHPVALNGAVCLRLHERPNGQLLLGCADRLLLYLLQEPGLSEKLGQTTCPKAALSDSFGALFPRDG